MTYDELCISYQKIVKIKEAYVTRECQALGIENVKGLYKNGKVAIDRTLTNREKKCTLAEELGHHYTSTGNILDLRYYQNAKQERRAREWAAKELIKYEDFRKAIKNYQDIHQIADELNVTIEVVQTFMDMLYRENLSHILLTNCECKTN